MQLEQLLDLDELDVMIKLGYVRANDHAHLPYRILNYTSQAQFENVWNDVTRQCRGLIYHRETDLVIARPFPKFFNLSQLADDEIPNEPFSVYEKVDGSLGILYPAHGKEFIATRGSFASTQAEWATKKYQARYMDRFSPQVGLTYLFEIIYPENRIVVNYGDFEDLVLLDVIDKETGESRFAEESPNWPGPAVKEYDGFSVLDHLIQHPGEANTEGFVVRFESGVRAKVKNDEYVRLHRIVTGVNARTIYEIVGARRLAEAGFSSKQVAYALRMDPNELGSMTIDSLLDRVPDEFYAWVGNVIAQLDDDYERIDGLVWLEYLACAEQAAHAIGTPEYRKAFAKFACASQFQGHLFRILDNKRYDDLIWTDLRPVAAKPFFEQNEDVA